MSVTSLTKVLALAALATFTYAVNGRAAVMVFDNFNVDEGHFTSAPNGSGSTNGINTTTSTLDRTTTDAYEGAGSQQLVLNDDATAGGTSRLRHLSGGGTPANNINFATS